MNGTLELNLKSCAVRAVRAAASAAGDTSGNCDAAVNIIEIGDVDRAAEQLEWAEENARSALHRIQEARTAIAKVKGGAA